ncbi:DUF2326 domain-containing protein [bacterium]|nr:DUF2326 domain-containing protein [bacterium]
MKLIKLYSNFPKKFHPVTFREGLNVVLGKITNPAARDKDTHNLGKTLFAQIIDFCLMKGKDSGFFLFKHTQFEEFVFFLELRIQTGEYITIRRSVNEGSKGSFMRHSTPNHDFTEWSEDEWDHWLLPFEASRQLLDGILDLTVLSPWSYRQAVSYSLRSQKDYDEPFKLAKFAGSHADWKPFLAHILGFSGEVVATGYEIEEELANLEKDERQLIARASGIEDVDQLRGQIQIIEQDVQTVEQEIEKFDFSPTDERITRALVADIDNRIVQLNEARYSLASDKARIESALGVRLSINLKGLEKLFKEAQIYFSDQVKKDYKSLEEFNKELAEERDEYLRKDLEEIEIQLITINTELADLNSKRSAALTSLADAESLSKYKRLTKQLVGRQADLETLRRLESVVDELTTKRSDIRSKKASLEKIRATLEQSIKNPPSRYATIRQYFDQIVFKVINQHANLFSRVNKENHLEVEVDILNESAKPSSAGEGFSYGRLLCIAFDLAIMRTYVSEPFPHFVFHDGLLETLDDRKKLNLIDVSREYCALGIQHIVTVIESEMPSLANGRKFAFDSSEIILTLSDEGDSGRLFKMPSW